MSDEEPKGRFFAPDKLENHSRKRKGKAFGKEKKKERGGRKETKRKKAMVRLFSFTMATLENV